jgi:nucleoside-diphosphate-sugar epimerase
MSDLKKILLTGHLGYLGSEFMQRYANDFEIIGYDLKEGDSILDYDNLKQKMQGCQQVVHLAAIPKPVEGRSFDDYFKTNVEGTHNVARAAEELGLERIVYASSTTVYGIESGIPFATPIKENQPIVSQYISADQLSCRDVDLSYHISKVMAEQIMAWYGLNKKIQTTSLRFGPIGKVFLGTSVSDANAAQAIKLALETDKELWFEPFSIVDEIDHIDITKAKAMLGYQPEKPSYPAEKVRSTLADRMMAEVK